MIRKGLLLVLALMMLSGYAAAEDWAVEDQEEYSIFDDFPMSELVQDHAESEDIPMASAQPEATQTPPAAPAAASGVKTAREEFIDNIIEWGHTLYLKADGKAQRAYKSSDIYVCKNFTVHLFKEVKDEFRMAEFPKKQLVIPNNMPSR